MTFDLTCYCVRFTPIIILRNNLHFNHAIIKIIRHSHYFVCTLKELLNIIRSSIKLEILETQKSLQRIKAEGKNDNSIMSLFSATKTNKDG